MAIPPIAGRALLVGCRGDAVGVERDVQAMAALLLRRGFIVECRTGPGATRAGIVTGYSDLIARVEPDQAAVIYFTGHGWRSFPENASGEFWQGICPSDVDDSTPEDFRGITSWELSILQWRLTKRTQNVTVILDCCHAAQMSRDAAVSRGGCRALPHPVRVGFDAHRRKLHALYGEDYDLGGRNSNPYAVRLGACGPNDSAYEAPVDGVDRGVFTVALLDVLNSVGEARVNWKLLEGPIRQRVQCQFSVQRPEIEGEVRRRPFSCDIVDVDEFVAIMGGPEDFVIESGQLTRVTSDDVFAVIPPDVLAYRPSDAIAEVRVTDVSATTCNARLQRWVGTLRELPRGAVAVAIEKQFERRAVRIDVSPDAPADARSAVEAAITNRATLRLASASDTTVVATLRIAGGVLAVTDARCPVFPLRAFPEGLREAVDDVGQLAAGQALRELEGEHGLSASDVEIEWGAVVPGGMQRLPQTGAALGLGDSMYIRVTSNVDRPRYAHIFNIGVYGRIALLTAGTPYGYELITTQAPLVLGQHFDGTVCGIPLGWPGDASVATVPTIDEVLVIVTSAQADLRGLETSPTQSAARAPGTPLQDLLFQFQDGNPRNLRGGTTTDDFYVKRLSYLLHPVAAKIANTPFEIDDSLWLAAMRTPGAWLPWSNGFAAPRCGDIVITVGDMVANRLADRDLRFDALVCTRSMDPAGSYVTYTQTFLAAAGASAASDDMIVYRGAVCDFVEICLWVSHGAEHVPELSQLLTVCSDPATIATVQRGLATDPGRPWVTSSGSTAALARIVYELLVSKTTQTVGLYRAAFLASERFGIDEQSGVQQARDCSFTVRIAATAPRSTGA